MGHWNPQSTHPMAQRPDYYFAYGSNLHPLRLGRRTPSLRLLGGAWLSGFELRFHKCCEHDGSAKADAFYTGSPVQGIRGAVYALDPSEFPILDEIEGLGAGGYDLRTSLVDVGDEAASVFFYAARASHIDPDRRPWAWYRDIVWRGALWHDMPSDYVETIRQVPAARDPDAERRRGNEALLAVMPDWSLRDGFDVL